MARKLELTWFGPRSCWKKRVTINGRQRTYYFKYGKSRSDREGYRLALREWRRKQRELGLQPPPDDDPFSILYEKSRQAEFEASDLNHLVELLRPLLTGPSQTPPAPVASQSATIGDAAEQFIATKQAEVPAALSPGRWDSLSRSIREFCDRIGPDAAMTEVTSQSLLQFREFLLARTTKISKAEGGIGRKTANDRMKDVRQFLRWCWEADFIQELPRILESRDLLIAYDDREIVTFTVDEVKRLLDGADERNELYLLLALNAAMLPADISDLTHAEVEWTVGRIFRVRSKTRKKKQASGEGKVPTVEYLLWPRTFELLKKYRSDDPRRVLLNSNGQPLKRSSVGEDGKIHNTSNIARNYDRLVKRLCIEQRKPFKTFRATGATKLEEHGVYGRYAQHYLGHAARAVAERHYVKPSREQMDAALQWLGSEFGLVD